MKRLALSLILVTMSVLASFGRGIMTFNEAQQQAYFLTDKMAYELDLTPAQYDEVYQVNLEYFLNVSGSNPWGYYWNYRNTDLAYILFDWQYSLYTRSEYFYRPITWRRGVWYLPVWDYYSRTHFYYDRPSIWHTWRGGLWTGRVHSTPSPFIGHRPSTHHGGMRHDPYPNGHPSHKDGGNHHNGQNGYNNGHNNGHNNGGGQSGHNGSNNRPNGGNNSHNNGYNNGHNNGGGQSGHNGSNNRPNGGNNGYNNGGSNNRPNGGGQVGSGNRGGNERPNRGGGHVNGNRGGENRGSGHAGGTRNFGGGHR